MQPEQSLYSDIKEAFKIFEKEYDVQILIAGLGGSSSIGTNNALSDLDIYVVYDSSGILPRKIRYKTPQNNEIHIISCSYDEIMRTVQEYNNETHLYPSYLNRTPEEMELNQKLTMYERKDYPRSLVYYTLMADTVWNLDVSYEACYEKFQDALIISDILDFYYTKAYGNYEHFILDRKEVFARKYITTVQEILYCRWMCDKQTIPPMDVKDLIKEYEHTFSEELKEEIAGVYDANLSATEDKFKAAVPSSQILNDFLYEALCDMKKLFAMLKDKRFAIQQKEC